MLTGKQRRHLRALAHHLDPIVHLGKEGLTDGVVGAMKTALLDHELVKVRLAQVVSGDRDALAPELAAATGSELVGAAGHTLVYYKRHPKEPRIVLPKPPRDKTGKDD